MIFACFFKALGQMGDHRFRKVLMLGVGLTLALLIAVYAAFLWFLQNLVGDSTTVPLLGEVTWINDLVGWSSLGLMLVLSVFLMVPVASAITSMFLDEVAQAVEDRHYPTLPAAPKISFWDQLRDTLNFLGVIIIANILALILYNPFAPLAPLIFWALNGFLLGMEYFQLAAMRRLGGAKARTMRKRHRWTIWGAGILMAVPLSIPLLNLIVPVLGAATFTHLFHGLQARSQ